MSDNKINELLNEEHIQFLFSIFKNQNSKLRLVGGCIRDALMNREIGDIDSASELEPYYVLELLKKNKIEYDDYAIRYGFFNKRAIRIYTTVDRCRCA